MAGTCEEYSFFIFASCEPLTEVVIIWSFNTDHNITAEELSEMYDLPHFKENGSFSSFHKKEENHLPFIP